MDIPEKPRSLAMNYTNNILYILNLKDEKEVADTLNKHFSEKIQKLKDGIDKSKMVDPLSQLQKKLSSNKEQFSLKPVTLKTVLFFLFFFNVGPPKEDIFSGHLLSPIFQSSIFTCYIYRFLPWKLHKSMYVP